MKPQTLSSYRKRKAISLFKSLFKKVPTKIEFVGLLGIEEAVFTVADNENKTYVVFHENDIMSYADGLEHYYTEEEIKCMYSGRP